MNFKILVFYVLSFGFLASFEAHALTQCDNQAELDALEQDIDTLISNETSIVVGKVISRRLIDEKNEVGIYQIDVVETIKGGISGVFEVTGIDLPEDYYDHGKNLTADQVRRHNSPKFLTKELSGSLASYVVEGTTSCYYAPVLMVGYEYLIFMSTPYHTKSFEPILDKKDSWLRAVQDISYTEK